MTDKNRETEMETSLLIGGDFETGTGPAETVLNPRTGEAIIGVAEAESSQIDRAVAQRHGAGQPVGLLDRAQPERLRRLTTS